MATRTKEHNEQFRTFNGVRYEGWPYDPTSERVAQYRRLGIRCRVISGDMFVASKQTDQADEIESGALLTKIKGEG
jgi:hypothetical protein